MKKLAWILAVLMLVLSFAGCAQNNGGSASSTGDAAEVVSDVAAVQAKGTLVVGITDFEPMDYAGENGEWIGFDADMAKAFAKELGVEAEFIEINWDNKSMELSTGAIDAVWNGMTLDDEVRGLMGVSEPYCKNAQVVVTRADVAANYQTVESLASLSFAAEKGSAGAKALEAENLPFTEVDTQAKALMEVSAGSVDACVIDLLMAGAMVGEGTSYDALAITSVELTSEEYGVGFRMGSDLVDAFNSFWKKAYDAGTVMSTAETYGIAQNIIEK